MHMLNSLTCLNPELPFKKYRRERRQEKALRRALVKSKPRYVYVEEVKGTLTRFYFVGRDSSSRHRIRVFGWSYVARTSVRFGVDPSAVFLEVPEDYEEFQVNSWRGCFVKKDTDLRGTPLEASNAKP